MESQQPPSNVHHDEAANRSNANTTPFLCRQSSTRWTPTTDQIRILKDLYYNNGVRSPTAEQIQRISAKLRQYGKIEGKNVFYWFQNHKARERQKKRFSADNIGIIPRNIQDHHHHHSNLYNAKFPNIGTFASSSGSGLVNYGGFGSTSSSSMEKSFRECSISQGQNFAWIGSHHDPYPFLEKRKYPMNGCNQALETEDDGEEAEMETLPLFPMHGQDTMKPDNDYFNSWCHRGDDVVSTGSRASLELTLNSYAATFPNSP